MCFARIIALSGIVLLVLTALAPGRAQQTPFAVMPEAPDILAFANGKMVPAAPIVRAVGGQLSYNKGQLVITRGDTTLRCRVKSQTMEWTRGRTKQTIKLSPEPFELNGEIYVPFLSLVTGLDGLATYQADLPGYLLRVGDTVLHLREVALNMNPAAFRERVPQWYLLAADGSELTRLTYCDNPTGMPAFSPSGDVMAFSRFGALYLRKPDEAEAQVLLPANYDDSERTYAGPCFTSDGQSILFTKFEKNTDEAPHETVGLVKRDGTGETALAAGSAPRPLPGEGAAGVGVNLTTTTAEHILRGGADQGFKPGMLLFTFRRQMVTGLLKVTKVNPTEMYANELADWKGTGIGDKAVTLSQLFTFTASGGQDGAARIGLVHPILGAIDFTPAFSLEGDGMVLSPDGQTLAWTGSSVGNPVVKVAKLNEQTAITLGSGDAPAFSPDGKLVVFIDGNGNLMLIDVDGKNARTLQPSWMGQVERPSFSPDGTEVLFIKNGQLCAIKPAEKTARVLAKGLAVSDYTVCPDGKHLLLMAAPGTP